MPKKASSTMKNVGVEEEKDAIVKQNVVDAEKCVKLCKKLICFVQNISIYKK